MSRPEFVVRTLLECGEEFELLTDNVEGMWDLTTELRAWVKWLTWGRQDTANRRRAFHLILASDAFKRYGTRARWWRWEDGEAVVIAEYPVPEREKKEETGNE